MNTANADVKMMLLMHGVYAYELFEELGIGQTTYGVRMRRELISSEKEKYKAAILKVAAKKAGFT